MRALNLFLLLLSIVASFSLYCRQDRHNTGPQTVYHTVRTAAFNQAWKNHKQRASKPNPYDQLVDNLMQKNSSVASYVKNITKHMRDNTLEKNYDNEVKELFYEYKQHKSHLLKVLNKYSDKPSEVFLEKNELQELKEIHPKIQTTINQIKFPLFALLSLHNPDSSFAECDSTTKLEDMTDYNGVLAAIRMNSADFYHLQANYKLGLPVDKDLHNTHIFAAFLHELGHIKYLHSYEKAFHFQLPHVQEYEADWYWARKNKQYAHALESLFRAFKKTKNTTTSDTHPSDEDRHKNLKEIRRLKEAESRWIWGPKGYEKYGDPAYEKAFINWSEKQK